MRHKFWKEKVITQSQGNREEMILRQGDVLGEQGDNSGLNLEGKNVITGEQMSSGREIKAVAFGMLS